MSRAIKLKNNDYLDSTGVVHNKSLLSTLLTNILTNITNLQNNKENIEVILYNNENGTTGAITLTETSANFTYLEIFGKNNDNEYSYTKVFSPNGKNVIIMANHKANSYVYIKTETLGISGTSVSRGGSSEARIGNNVSTIYSVNNNIIYITRIVGHR